jgi:hypothetical protein
MSLCTEQLATKVLVTYNALTERNKYSSKYRRAKSIEKNVGSVVDPDPDPDR